MIIPQLKTAIENSEYFKTYPGFKQRITLEKRNIERLHDLYGQADRLGLDYLRQNPHLTVSDVKLIESVL
ncbi:MAG TPA: hypothetical protein VJ780_06225 [Flavobacterium sp.]|nr:hypothetical protein [Flavobacterium sp.]